ncbi:tyrosine-type recombinase/integrase [Streptomyces sp. A7024]|uniref:Tyrosine-type recombinase/integrase n=1 Tax=Streptomyces coryli TaxID=1128680 RepID=A0A6G4UA59_9ACTN|nr:tyrosine-type recombinase/integrase [Streptomyces coryli]NGN68576.1 tyrosine-type recombinase/integrase [Streptomyces coryli]
MVETGDGAPSATELRLAFRWGVVPGREEQDPPEELSQAYLWLLKRSLPVPALMDASTLRQVQYRLSFKLDGKEAGGETTRRRRRVLNTAVEYAVEAKELPSNPLGPIKKVQRGSSARVDPRGLANASQWAQLHTAVSYIGTWERNKGRRLMAFYAVLYYAALRPSEAIALRTTDCTLPKKGWGMLTLRKSAPASGKQWTDSGVRQEQRGLKARAADEDRPVPIPPVLVQLLREHIKTFGTAKDGRLFQNERGGTVGTSYYWRVWDDARQLALPPEKRDSPLAKRPYDLRHTCITKWLNAGVPPAEVARRVGNSPEVIHRVYEGCIDGHQEALNRRIEEALSDDETSVQSKDEEGDQPEGDRGTDDL